MGVAVAMFKPAPTPVLSPAEQAIYDAINQAAENRECCPVNIDLEILAGFNSCSMGSAVVRRLERKGLIRVERYQRFRRVQIVATGLWTARSPSQHVERAHVPRGTYSQGPAPQSGKLAKKARKLSVGTP